MWKTRRKKVKRKEEICERWYCVYLFSALNRMLDYTHIRLWVEHFKIKWSFSYVAPSYDLRNDTCLMRPWIFNIFFRLQQMFDCFSLMRFALCKWENEKASSFVASVILPSGHCLESIKRSRLFWFDRKRPAKLRKISQWSEHILRGLNSLLYRCDR